jgi:hypothetical protein
MCPADGFHDYLFYDLLLRFRESLVADLREEESRMEILMSLLIIILVEFKKCNNCRDNFYEV